MHGQNGLSFTVDPRYSLGWKYRVNGSDTPLRAGQTNKLEGRWINRQSLRLTDIPIAVLEERIYTVLSSPAGIVKKRAEIQPQERVW